MKSREILRKNGRAFSWSASFLRRDSASSIADLYAFCRYVDDLVDLENLPCDQILKDLNASSSLIEPVKNMISLQQKYQMSKEYSFIFVSTVENDRCGKCIQTKAELIRYCYGVASTVGLMMCEIFGLKNKHALHYAIDLGIGMQLTNIARDIYEDAKNNRMYLPQDFFEKNITAHEVLQGTRNFELLAANEKVLKLADLYYKSADMGMAYLTPKVRFAILVASRLYQAKGQQIRSNPVLYLKKRADVPLSGKIFYTLKALASFPKLTKKNHKEMHNAFLHQDLISLPDVNYK